MNQEEQKEKYSAFISDVSEILGLGKPVDILKLCMVTDRFFKPLQNQVKEFEAQIEKMKCGGNCKFEYWINTGGCYDQKMPIYDEELRIEVIEKNDEFVAVIACNSDLRINVDLFEFQGHGKTKEEAIEDFKKNIFELSEKIECVKNRLIANIYIVQEKGVW